MPMLSHIMLPIDIFVSLEICLLFIYLFTKSAAVESVQREVADPGKPGDIGAPMPGVIVEVRVQRKHRNYTLLFSIYVLQSSNHLLS